MSVKILPNGIAVLENDLASRWIEECGDLVHEPTVRAEICPLLHPGDVVVDAGAFLGGHTRAYLDTVGPTGRVLAFEPNPVSFECLKHNCPQAELNNCGLGTSERFVTGSDDPNNHGAHSLSYHQDGPMRVITLDSLKLERLDFFKLDVEGWEYRAISGALGTISRCRPILYVELNRGALAKQGRMPIEIVRLVQGMDYRLQFLEAKHSLRMEQIDVFFHPL